MNDTANQAADNTAKQNETPEFKLNNMEIGAVYFDIYLANAVTHGLHENIDSLRATFAGKYAYLKSLGAEQRKAETGDDKLNSSIQRTMRQAWPDNKAFAASMAETLKGAVNDDKLPLAVAIETERRELVAIAEMAKMEVTIHEHHTHEAAPETSGQRAWRKFRNVGAAMCIVGGIIGGIIVKQNADERQENHKNLKATQELVTKGDSTTQNMVVVGDSLTQRNVDSVGKHLHTDLYNTQGKTQRMIRNMSNNIKENTVTLDSLKLNN